MIQCGLPAMTSDARAPEEEHWATISLRWEEGPLLVPLGTDRLISASISADISADLAQVTLGTDWLECPLAKERFGSEPVRSAVLHRVCVRPCRYYHCIRGTAKAQRPDAQVCGTLERDRASLPFLITLADITPCSAN